MLLRCSSQARLYNLKLVVHVSSVLLVTDMTSCLHLVCQGGIILLDATLVVATEGVATEVRVGIVEVGLRFLCLFGVRLQMSALVRVRIGQLVLTCTIPQTKSSGNPYRSTVSTKTRSAST
jgi:hypothetical protein